MSNLGIGSARIDLILEKDTYRPGEHISGFFLLKGGTIDQLIKRIDCDLVIVNRGKVEEVVDSTTIYTSTLIHTNEVNKISFKFKLPETIHVSNADHVYRFKTKLTFNEGVQSNDQDIIHIVS